MSDIYDEIKVTDKCTFSEGGNKKISCDYLSQYWYRLIIWHLTGSVGTRLKELYWAFILVKEKWSCYKPGVAQRVGRGIALLFHDRGTRRWWVVSSTPQPHFTPEKDTVPILQEAGWAPGPVWVGGKSCPHRDSIPDRPARSQSLYRLSYLAHFRIGADIYSPVLYY